MNIKYLIVLAALSSPVFAQEPVPAAEFDNYSVGTTLYFTKDGMFYGSEQFLEDRKSVWRAEDGSCVNGSWVEIEGGICFTYDGRSNSHCWALTREDGKITIESMFATPTQPSTMLEVSGQDTVPIICTGPSVGA